MSLQSAHQAYQAGRLEEAEKQLFGHMRQHPDDAMGLHLGALVASGRGDFRTALGRIRLSLRDATNRHEKLNTQGNILRTLGDDVSASDAFRAALLDRPDYKVAQFNIARLLFETAKFQEAAQHFGAVTKADPSNQAAWRGLFHALLESQDLDAVDNLLKTAPLSESKKNDLTARLAFYRGDSDTALTQLKRSTLDQSGGNDAFTFALQILHLTGRWDESDSFIMSVLSRHPDRPDLWEPAIRSLFKAGNIEAAQSTLSEAPAGLPVELVRVEMLIAQSQFAEAETLAMQALQDAPGYQPIMQRLCRAALGNHNYDLAQEVADIGLLASPNNQFYYAVKATAGRAKGQDYRYYFDYERFVRPYDLDPPEGWSDMASFNADLKEALTRLHGFRGTPLDQTLKFGTQTAPNLKFVDSPVIRAFFSAVDPAIREYLAVIGNDPKHAFLRRNVGGYSIRSAWSVRLGAGGHHVNHVHPQGWISSAYYVDVPEGSGKEGWIKFGEPPAPLNAALGQGPEHELQPKAGRLVLFPSYLWHGTHPIQNNGTRLTLPIDILPDKP